MPFPDSPRVVYGRNPLVEVICQLRFPSVLRIDSTVPVEFQELIRGDFPIFNTAESADIRLNLPPGLANLIGQDEPLSFRTGKSSYDFVNTDGTSKIGLTRDFLSLSTNSYSRWEEFRDRLANPLDALNQVYSPAFFTRIGLRYRDIIRRSTLGLSDAPWSELLRPHILGELSSVDVAPNIDHAVGEARIRLNENAGNVVIRHGLVLLQDGGSSETCYLVDCDFYTETQVEVNDALDILNGLNRRSGRLFRWCITDKLHDAMEPEEIQHPE